MRPCSSRSSTTQSFSSRSRSNTSRRAVKKSEYNANISSRSCGESASRSVTSQRGDLEESGACVESVMKVGRKVVSVVPGDGEDAGRIGHVAERARGGEQRIAFRKSNEQMIETTLARLSEQPHDELTRDGRIVIHRAEETPISETQRRARFRQGRAPQDFRGGVVDRPRRARERVVRIDDALLVRALVPETGHAGDDTIALDDDEIFRIEATRQPV